MPGFEISISSGTPCAQAALDGRDLSQSPYSSFAPLKGAPFAEWFYRVDSLCQAEAGTSAYQVKLIAPPVHARLLTHALRGRSVSVQPPLVSMEHRLRWADELDKEVWHFKSDPRAEPFDTLRAGCMGGASRPAGSLPLTDGRKILLDEPRCPEETHVVLCGAAVRLADLPPAPGSLMQAVVVPGRGDDWTVQEIRRGQALIACPPAQLTSFLAQWYMAFAAVDRLADIRRSCLNRAMFCSSSGAPIHPLPSPPRQAAPRSSSAPIRPAPVCSVPPPLPKRVYNKVLMLTEPGPMIDLEMDDLADMNRSATLPFLVSTLPEGMTVGLTSSDPAVGKPCADSTCRLLKEGRFTLTAAISSHPDCSDSAACQVYIYRPVTDIRLTQPGEPAVGEHFSLNPALAPANADNKDLLTFSVQPNDLLQLTDRASGQFRALKQGAAVITARVGSVTRTISVTIYPAAADVRTEPTRSVKLGQAGNRLSAQILPAGARATIAWRSGDRSILEVDPSTGHLTPIQEGVCPVTVTLTNRQGAVLAQATTQVTVLPRHTVVTPDSLFIIGLCSWIAGCWLGRYIDPGWLGPGCAAGVFLSAASLWRDRTPFNIAANLILLALILLFPY